MNKSERIAYISGIVDGEAYLGIKKSTWGMRNRKDVHNPTYSERIQIRMACKPILEFIKNEFGGTVYTEKRIYNSEKGYTSRKIMSVYAATDKKAYNFIKEIFPYLIEKKTQAECIIRLRKNKEKPESKMRGGKNRKKLMDSKIIVEREALYQKCKDCHH